MKNIHFLKSILLILTLFSAFEVAAEVVTVNGSAMQGSGVVIGENKVITNCHLFKGEYTGNITVKHAKSHYGRIKDQEYYFSGARVMAEKDLCLIEPNTHRFENSEIEKTYKDNDKVKSVNIIEDNQGKIVEIVKKPDVELIGTSSPWEKGASGGGLYNENNKLIGITTYIDHSGEKSVYWAVSVNDIEKLFQLPRVMQVKDVSLYDSYYKYKIMPNKPTELSGLNNK